MSLERSFCFVETEGSGNAATTKAGSLQTETSYLAQDVSPTWVGFPLVNMQLLKLLGTQS